jgi:hypothetical protein
MVTFSINGSQITADVDLDTPRGSENRSEIFAGRSKTQRETAESR